MYLRVERRGGGVNERESMCGINQPSSITDHDQCDNTKIDVKVRKNNTMVGSKPSLSW